jgi:hypothetical protein
MQSGSAFERLMLAISNGKRFAQVAIMLRGSIGYRLAATGPWQQLLGQFETVDLEQISAAATDDRVDTKFVLREDVLFGVLNRLVGDYLVLDVDGKRFSTYRTQYFDTESFALFRRHHIGGSSRYKVRARTYLNTDTSFVEIKRKTRRGATTKLRLQTEQFQTRLLVDAREFIDQHCSARASDLIPSLLNNFDRIHLLSRNSEERLTIDLNVQVETGATPVHLPGIAIAEFKQPRSAGARRSAAFLNQMRAIHARPTGFSKYCMGLLLTNSGIKHNLFKPQLRRLNRLMEEPHAVC